MRALLPAALIGILLWLLYAGWPNSKSNIAISERERSIVQKPVKVAASIESPPEQFSTQRNLPSSMPSLQPDIELSKNKVLLLVEKMASDERTRVRLKRIQTITDANGLTRTFSECIIDAPDPGFRAAAELQLTEISQQCPSLQAEIGNWVNRYLNIQNKHRVVTVQSQVTFPDGNVGLDFATYTDTDYITEKEFVPGKWLYHGGSWNAFGSRNADQILAERWLDLWK
jgi:hypothetical protein